MTGPWTYRGVILQKDLSLGIKGTGHSSIINVPGTDDWYIAYHRFAMPGGDGNHRETTIDKLEFGADGLMKAVVPTLESVAPQTIELPAAPPEIDVTVTGRCVAGKVTLVVQAKNVDDVPVDPHGADAIRQQDTSASLQPGKSSAQAFTTRLANDRARHGLGHGECGARRRAGDFGDRSAVLAAGLRLTTR